MEMATIQSQLMPQHFSLHHPEPHQPLLEESIRHLLLQLEAGSVSNFSHFHSIFSRFIQTLPSPPIEIIWFYSVVNFRSTMFDQTDLTGRVLALKDLFHLLVSCSNSCTGLRSVAVLAPFVSEMYNLVIEFKLHNRGSSVERVGREIDCLVEGVLSFIILCCCRGAGEHDDSPTFSRCFTDLVKVWSFERCGRDAEAGDYLKAFFPVVPPEFCIRLREGCGVGCLAGIVMFEAFLLRLCFKMNLKDLKEEPEKELQKIAADMIADLKSCYFLDILLEVLSEPIIPITCLLSYNDELMLRKVLFNAIVFVEYPFTNPESKQQHCSNHLKSLALRWVLVVEKAISFMRQQGEENKASSYARAFSESLERSQLVGWLTNSQGIEEHMIKPVFPTPTAFFDWLSNLQNLCSRSAGPKEVMLFEREVQCRVRMNGNSLPIEESTGQNSAHCHNFSDEPVDDFEMVQSLDVSDSKLSCCTLSKDNEGTRKRKEERKDEGRMQVKLLRSHACDGFMGSIVPFRKENYWMKDDIEVEGSIPDDEMEIMV